MTETLNPPKVPAPPGDDLQYYLDTTLEYLRSQPGQAKVGDVCRYETEEGNRCAVGLWMPEGHPARRYVGSLPSLRRSHPDLAAIAWPVAGDEDPEWDGKFHFGSPEGIREADSGLRLAISLQTLHDHDNYRADGNGLNAAGESEARDIANRYGLTYPEPASRPALRAR